MTKGVTGKDVMLGWGVFVALVIESLAIVCLLTVTCLVHDFNDRLPIKSVG